MKKASDFRRIARGALQNTWGLAIVASIIAGILGAGSSSMPSFNVNLGGFTSGGSASDVGSGIIGGGAISEEFMAVLVGLLAFVGIFATIMSIVYFFIGSVVNIGYRRFNLELVNGNGASLRSLFAYFKYWKSALAAILLQAIFVFLWSLLFVIPGIIAAYRYSMTSYVLAENPGLSARDAINESKRLMQGNKWRLFCLQFSFIGWALLCLFTCGIGYIFLSPYTAAAEAAFYKEIAHPYEEYVETSF